MPRPEQAPQCKDCDWDMVRIGSQYYCQQTRCSRFALPTDAMGDTPAENVERQQDEGEAREARKL